MVQPAKLALPVGRTHSDRLFVGIDTFDVERNTVNSESLFDHPLDFSFICRQTKILAFERQPGTWP